MKQVGLNFMKHSPVLGTTVAAVPLAFPVLPGPVAPPGWEKAMAGVSGTSPGVPCVAPASRGNRRLQQLVDCVLWVRISQTQIPVAQRGGPPRAPWPGIIQRTPAM